MRKEHLKALFWLLVVCSWVLGVVMGRWFETNEFFLEISKAVRVISPHQLGVWWEPLAYFTLTVMAIFILSQLFFGVGAAMFLFARGMYDSVLITQLEATVGGWTFTNFPADQIWIVLMFILILTVNLPLCLWSGQLGVQRASYILYRLRGVPISPDYGTEPLSKFLLILVASIITGLIGALLLSYA